MSPTHPRYLLAHSILRSRFELIEDRFDRLVCRPSFGGTLCDFREVASVVADLLEKMVEFDWNYIGNTQLLKPSEDPKGEAQARVSRAQGELVRTQKALRRVETEIVQRQAILVALEAADPEVVPEHCGVPMVKPDYAPTRWMCRRCCQWAKK